MSARSAHPAGAGKAPAARTGPDDRGSWLSKAPAVSAGDACCCPARPAVRVIMPPCPARPHTTELLLCAHHYHASRAILATAKAIVRELPGTPQDVAAWIGLEQADAPSLAG